MQEFRELSSVPPLDGEAFYQLTIGFFPCQITLFELVRNLIGKSHIKNVQVQGWSFENRSKIPSINVELC